LIPLASLAGPGPSGIPEGAPLSSWSFRPGSAKFWPRLG